MTLNQVIKRIQTLALDHKQVRNFYQGLVTDFLTDKTTLYPSAFLQFVNGSLSTAGKAMSVTYRLYLLDLVHLSQDTKANEQDVQSDMIQVMMDLVAQMNYPGFDDWRLSPDNQVTIYAENENDFTTGCSIDFTLRTMFTQNICQVPTVFNEFTPTDTDMKTLYDIEFISDGTEGYTLTIPGIKGKRIMLITRGNNILYKVSNNPASSEYTWDETTITLGVPVNPAGGERFLILYRNY